MNPISDIASKLSYIKTKLSRKGQELYLHIQNVLLNLNVVNYYLKTLKEMDSSK